MRRTNLAISLSFLLFPAVAAAAEITDVLDAADGDDPYDFNLEVTYDHQEAWGLIQREYQCSNTRVDAQGNTTTLSPSQAGYDPNCVKGDRLVNAREMDYRRTVDTVNFLARFASWRDLELRVLLPYIASDQTTLSLAGTGGDPGLKPIKAYCVKGQDCSPSSIYREDAAGNPDVLNSLFQLPFTGPDRGGIGDMEFGLWWSPWNAERDDTVATWMLGINYLAPTAEVMQAGQTVDGVLQEGTGLGRKVHELTFTTRMSRRFSKMDPYLGFDFTLVLNDRKSLFDDYGRGQTLITPGNNFAIAFGSEVVPWENPQKHQKFSIDFGGRFAYQFEGRDYSPIFDALGASTCSDSARRAGAQGCTLTTLKGTGPGSDIMLANGITDVEQYGEVWGWFGFNVQASRFVKFRTQVNISHQFDHFLTSADSGKDNRKTEFQVVDGVEVPRYRPGFIDPGTEEENPTFNSNLDMIGRRLRLAEHLNLTAFVTAALTF